MSEIECLACSTCLCVDSIAQKLSCFLCSSVMIIFVNCNPTLLPSDAFWFAEGSTQMWSRGSLTDVDRCGVLCLEVSQSTKTTARTTWFASQGQCFCLRSVSDKEFMRCSSILRIAVFTKMSALFMVWCLWFFPAHLGCLILSKAR